MKSVFPSPDGDPDQYRMDSRHAEERAGGCDESADCRSICRRLFSGKTFTDYCEEYSASAVSQMAAVFDILGPASESGLNSLAGDENKRRYLRIMLNIQPTDGGSQSVLHRIDTDDTNDPDPTLDPWTANHQKRILVWLSENPEIIKIFRDSGPDYNTPHFEILTLISDTTSGSEAGSLNRGLGANDSGDGFVDKLLEEENEVGLQWVHDYFKSLCTSASSPRRCIFKSFYCELGIADDNAADYFDYDFFTDTLDHVLANHLLTGAPSWLTGAGSSEGIPERRRALWGDDICDQVDTS